MKPRQSIVYRCPRAGEQIMCPADEVVREAHVHLHRAEEWIKPGQPIPKCETHNVDLVPAP
jgi:hypothetical protein